MSKAMAPSAEQEGHDAQLRRAEKEDAAADDLYPMIKWKYDLFLYLMGNLVDLFFREVVPRGSWKVPRSGPVLFVAAPHANQVSMDIFLGAQSSTSSNLA